LYRSQSGLLSWSISLHLLESGLSQHPHFEMLLDVSNFNLILHLTSDLVACRWQLGPCKCLHTDTCHCLCPLCSYTHSLWSPSTWCLWWASLRDLLGGESLLGWGIHGRT
jgi:hypothetical protein